MIDSDDYPSHAEALDLIGGRRSIRESLLRVADGERSEYCRDLPPLRQRPEAIRCLAFRVPVQTELWP